MITFSDLGRKGRMGNAMFQYAALKSKAIDLNCKIFILNPKIQIHDNQICQLFNFKLSAKICDKREYNELIKKHINREYIEHRNFLKGINKEKIIHDNHYNSTKVGTNIKGFFESEYYFKQNKELIKKEFELKDEIINAARKQFKKLTDKYPNNQIIAIHIRRGDIIEKNIPLNKKFCLNNMNNNQKSVKYLKEAYKKFEDITEKIYIIFTGGSLSNNNKKDVEWCKNNFKGNNFIFSEKNNSIQDFALLTLCHHMILTNTSTFGWWAGYLNKNPNKRIIVPTFLEKDSNKYIKNYWSNEFIRV